MIPVGLLVALCIAAAVGYFVFFHEPDVVYKYQVSDQAVYVGGNPAFKKRRDAERYGEKLRRAGYPVYGIRRARNGYYYVDRWGIDRD